jgi:hypothetical protein
VISRKSDLTPSRIGMFKAIIFMFVLLFFLSVARSWDDEECECSCNQPEHISWDVKPINPYIDTVIVTDPYSD